jgi:hypothetical protein
LQRVERVALQDKELGRRWLHLAHDAEYDPSNCFHLELRWNACPGYLVRDFVQGLFRFIYRSIVVGSIENHTIIAMYRRARTAGLTMVQLPIRLLDDPFIAPSYVAIRGAEVCFSAT